MRSDRISSIQMSSDDLSIIFSPPDYLKDAGEKHIFIRTCLPASGKQACMNLLVVYFDKIVILRDC